MGRIVTLSVVAVLLAVLALTRPGSLELKLDRERAKRRSNGRTKVPEDVSAEIAHELSQAWSNFNDVVQRRQVHMQRDPLGGLPWNLSSSVIDDYLLITVAVPHGKEGQPKSDRRLVGVLGSFVPYRPRDDLLVLAGLMALSYVLSWLSPWLNFFLAAPSLWRPWSLLLTSLHSDALLGTVLCATSVVNTGLLLQSDLGREMYLALFFAPGALAAVGEMLGRKHARPVGAFAAVWAMLLHTALRHPTVTYSVYGKEMSALAVMGLQVVLPLTSSPRAFLYQIPTFATGAACGLASIVWLAEPQVDLSALAARLHVDAYLGDDGLTPPMLVGAILAGNFAFGQLVMALTPA